MTIVSDRSVGDARTDSRSLGSVADEVLCIDPRFDDPPSMDLGTEPGWQRFRARQAAKPGYPRAVLAVALLGLIASNFMVSVLAAVVGPLAEEFETTTATMIWVVLGPNLGFAVLAVTAGKLADLYGRRNAFLVALFGSMIFGGLSALAWSPLSLIGFRTVSAIFGSATGPAGVAIISG